MTELKYPTLLEICREDKKSYLGFGFASDELKEYNSKREVLKDSKEITELKIHLPKNNTENAQK
jgi:uncharacterized protein YgfB (UPF0149 family)